MRSDEPDAMHSVSFICPAVDVEGDVDDVAAVVPRVRGVASLDSGEALENAVGSQPVNDGPLSAT